LTRIEVGILNLAGEFAADKDKAREVRETFIIPALENGHEVVLNFAGVEFATQSFVHALISVALRRFGDAALELIVFNDCSEAVQTIVETVVDYTLFAPGTADDDA